MQKTKPILMTIVVFAIIISSAISAMALEGGRTGILLKDIDIAPKDVSLKISLSKNKVKSTVGKKFKLDYIVDQRYHSLCLGIYAIGKFAYIFRLNKPVPHYLGIAGY